jgi:hypothetical protein
MQHHLTYNGDCLELQQSPACFSSPAAKDDASEERFEQQEAASAAMESQTHTERTEDYQAQTDGK